MGKRIEDMTPEELRAELSKEKAKNNRLQGRPNNLKVSEKGGVSVYGLGRFPVTLYKEQWQKLLAMAEQINAFIAENEAVLKTKEKVGETVEA